VARRTQVLYVDDIDGSDADGTVRFGLAGVNYEIDLNVKHADQFTKAIGPFIAGARKVSSSRGPARGALPYRHDQPDVRAWARTQGLTVSDRGRIPVDVLASARPRTSEVEICQPFISTSRDTASSPRCCQRGEERQPAVLAL
jgi:Lsr2